MTKYRALSIRQPYAEQILRGIKKVEYRSIATRIRGKFYIYASMTPGRAIDFRRLGVEPGGLPTGVLVGTAEIVGCTGKRGNYKWHLKKPMRLTKRLKPKRHPQPVWFRPF